MRSQLIIRVPSKLKAKLADKAKRKGLSMNALAIQIFWQWFEDNKTA